MSGELALYASFMLFGVFISSVSQVLLKKEAGKPHDSLLKEYLNAPTLTAYLIFFAATFLSIYAYKVVPLSMGAILESTGYIYTTVFGAVIFKERMNGLKTLALGMILLGIAVYALSA